MSHTPEEFDRIRPYADHEVEEVLERVLANPSFFKMSRFLFPDKSDKEVTQWVKDTNTVSSFQSKFAHPAMRTILDKTVNELRFTGLDNIQKDRFYLFISNHRDIILDSAILNVALIENGFQTLETAIGNNLLNDPLVEDLTRLNKNFVVMRNASRKEQYLHSRTLSSYIRYAINTKGTSVWIAQKEGRTKDGMDRTQPGLLKMLAMSCDEDLADCFRKLHIVPTAISYEFDPCDYLKIPELRAVQNDEEYEKSQDEDFNSIITGLTGSKGRVELSIGSELTDELDELNAASTPNEKMKILGQLIDRKIYNQYRLWPNNYVAADLLRGSSHYSEHYTPEDQQRFQEYMNSQLAKLGRITDVERQLYLRMYANPVITCHEAPA